MAKSKAREHVWLQCKDCKDLNYRTNVRVQGGVPKLEFNKFCPRECKVTVHKIKRK